MKIKFLAVLAAFALFSSADARIEEYATSFEPSDGYAASQASIADNTSDSWSVVTGSAKPVDSTTTTPFGSGTLSVELSADTVINRNISVTDKRFVWVQGYFKGAGSSATPDFSSLGDASAIVFFGDTEIQAWDGSLGTPAFVGTGQTLSETEWTLILLGLDFENKTYDVYITREGQATPVTPTSGGLGFFTNTLEGLSGFQALASQTSYFDEFGVFSWLPYDANGDAQVDVADVVTMVNAKNGTALTDPILIRNANAGSLDDSNDAIQQADVTAVVNVLSGM
jgi:hypothetical protein